VASVAADRLLVPGADAAARRVPMPAATAAPEYVHVRPGFAFDAVLADAARHLDVASARWVAKSIELPTDRLDLVGPSWPWALVLHALALAAAGAAIGLALTRRLGSLRSGRVAAR
jgi:hypothetical protein